MSGVVGDDHYKQMPRDTVGVTRYRTLTALDQWPWVMGIHDIFLQFLAGNGVFRMSEKNSRVGPTNAQW